MGYMETPNLPKGPVEIAIIDGRVDKEIENCLSEFGIRVIKTRRHPLLYEAIAYHPDVMLTHCGGKLIVHSPDIDKNLYDELESCGFEMLCGKTKLAGKYPHNIAYNVAIVGKVAFHNVKYTDPVIKKALEKQNIALIHVKQGYAKCAVSIIDEKCIITSDHGIARQAEKVEIEVIEIPSEQEITLPHMDHGFIGGSSFLIDHHKWAITGDIELLESKSKIMACLSKKKVEVVSLSKKSVTDIGSIIPIRIK